MAKVKDMTVEDLKQLIEYKLIEILGDPDSGLQLKEEFKVKLEQRLKKPSKITPHEEVFSSFS